MAMMVNENFRAARKQEVFAGLAGPELPQQPDRTSVDFH
jgi:hypothetical protein